MRILTGILTNINNSLIVAYSNDMPGFTCSNSMINDLPMAGLDFDGKPKHSIYRRLQT